MQRARTFFFAGACIFLLALIGAADAAGAAGLNLGWGAYCPTFAGSQLNISDPCDGSRQAAGTVYTLVGSVTLPRYLPMCVAEDFFIEIQEGAAQLSDYWHLENENQPGWSNPGGCRGASASTGNLGSLSVQITPGAFVGAYTGCDKTFWGPNTAGGVNYGVLVPDGYPGVVDPRRARLIGHFAKYPGSPMYSFPQYCNFIATFDTNHQVADATNSPSYACGGCQNGVCLVYSQLILYQQAGTPGGDLVITNQDVRNFVTWQGGTGTDCPVAVPTRRATWGQVKSLYR